MSKKPSSYIPDIISIEDIKLKELYTFTINPCDDHQYFKLDYSSRIESCKIFMQHLIDQMSATPILLHPEVSPRGRIHYHGTIKFNTNCDLLKFYISHIPQILSKCTLEIDSISDPSKWSEYISKQDNLFGWTISNYRVSHPIPQTKLSKLLS